eukprot:SAG31_NODE_878_length_11297_cov_3.770714_8_plen_156_part_00
MVMETRIDSVVRERILLAFFRGRDYHRTRAVETSSYEAVGHDFRISSESLGVHDVFAMCGRVRVRGRANREGSKDGGAESRRAAVDWPELFARARVPTVVIRRCIEHLVGADLYHRENLFRSIGLDDPSAALGHQAQICYVLLYFDPGCACDLHL